MWFNVSKQTLNVIIINSDKNYYTLKSAGLFLWVVWGTVNRNTQLGCSCWVKWTARSYFTTEHQGWVILTQPVCLFFLFIKFSHRQTVKQEIVLLHNFFPFEYILKCNLLWFQSWFFSIITPVTQSFRNHFNLLLKKTFIIIIIVKTAGVELFRFLWSIEAQKNSIYLK